MYLNIPAYLLSKNKPSLKEILDKCHYMQHHTDVLYVKAVSCPNNIALFVSTSHYVTTADLDAITDLKLGFCWSMGELYILPKYL